MPRPAAIMTSSRIMIGEVTAIDMIEVLVPEYTPVSNCFIRVSHPSESVRRSDETDWSADSIKNTFRSEKVAGTSRPVAHPKKINRHLSEQTCFLDIKMGTRVRLSH